MKYILFIFLFSCTSEQPESVRNSAIEQTFVGKDLEFFNEFNQMRISRNLPTLKGNKQLTVGCKEHTEYMVANDSLSHIGVGYRKIKSNAISFSEVVAYGYVTQSSFLAGYMNSESHREALTDENKTDIGISTIGLYQTVNLGEYEK